MKKTFLSATLLALFFVTNVMSAQDQSLVFGSSTMIPKESIQSRNAHFPDLGRYLSEQLQYPEPAQKNGMEGMVTVVATIGEDGEVMSVVLVEGIGFGCDREVLALVSNMPKWTPALKNGQEVSQKVLIRALFRLK